MLLSRLTPRLETSAIESWEPGLAGCIPPIIEGCELMAKGVFDDRGERPACPRRELLGLYQHIVIQADCGSHASNIRRYINMSPPGVTRSCFITGAVRSSVTNQSGTTRFGRRSGPRIPLLGRYRTLNPLVACPSDRPYPRVSPTSLSALSFPTVAEVTPRIGIQAPQLRTQPRWVRVSSRKPTDSRNAEHSCCSGHA